MPRWGNLLSLPRLKSRGFPEVLVDDALETLEAFVLERPDIRDDLRLVHGICLAPDGKPYAHAWLEDTSTRQAIFVAVVDGKRQMLGAEQDEYDAGMRVQERTRYTWRQALRQNQRSGHYGPWRQRYRALCRQPT